MWRFVRRYALTFFMLAVGFVVSFTPNANVVDPRLLASSPDRYAAPRVLFGVPLTGLPPFGLRHLDLQNLETIAKSDSRTLVRITTSCEGTQLVFHLSVNDKLHRELRSARRVFAVGGTYLSRERVLVLQQVSVRYGFWGTITGFFYGLTRHWGDHRAAVTAASFLVWFIASAIYTSFLLLTGSVGEAVDTVKDALD